MGLADLAQRNKLRLVATGNVHYLTPDDAPLHDVLTCIRHRVPLERANGLLRTNAEYYFHSPQEMAALFAEWPAALCATVDIAERCNARLPLGPQGLPAIAAPHGMSAGEYLRYLCEDGLSRKMKSSSAVRSQASTLADYHAALNRELRIVDEQSLTNYFLIVHDLMRFARSQNILCQGRGSAANSLVSYLLDITPIDPVAGGLVFERFLSAERATAPDIDVDFAADRREEAIQYLYQKYGHDHAAMACTVVTFGARQAVRDVGMALGFSTEIIDQVSGNLDAQFAANLTTLPNLRSVIPEAQLASPRWQQWLGLASAIEGFPRHLGIHNGGMIISGASLIEQIPVEPATMDDRFVVQWDKDSLEMTGWVKLDVLGLRMLAAISDACDLVAQQTGQRPDLNALRLDDPRVYDMICRGATVGVFRSKAVLKPR